MNAILQTQSLGKSYRSGKRELTVLRDVTFSLPVGSSCAVVGPSGSGKTTLLGLCAGLDRPTTGSIILDGEDLARLDEEALSRLRNRLIGFVFQTFQLIPTLTALENVMVPAELGGLANVNPRATKLLDQVGLADRLHHYPSQLSGGEQQRVAMARAFVTRPKILFADEPTGNLDDETGAVVQDLLFRLNSESNATLMLVTHDMDLASRAQRIIRLKGGRVVSDQAVQPLDQPVGVRR